MALRWGICSAGKISHDFVVGLKTLPETSHKVVAEVDVVYIDTIHPTHLS